jgi:hypothetical protein
MREVNFSIPNVNKASVGITTALYDRRALDCTSTLPLINSLNHLAYLTTSSARIRDILTVDGGVERLVCILKAGRSKDMMEMWKWNLAFQCVVNIGVRGSENVRTRVVEADMVPVIATILDNYIKVVDKCKEKSGETDSKRHNHRTTSKHSSSHFRDPSGQAPAPGSFGNGLNRAAADQRLSRRQAPPPSIEIPAPFSQAQSSTDPHAMDMTPTAPQFAVTSPPERTTFAPQQHVHRSHHHHHRSQEVRQYDNLLDNALRNVDQSRFAEAIQPLATALPAMDVADGFNLRPVRDIDRLPSMVPGIHSGITSQPESPTTPNPPINSIAATTLGASRRRPSIRHQRSMSGTSDDANADELASDESAGPEAVEEPLVDIQTGVELPGMDDRDAMLDAVDAPLGLTAQDASETQDAQTFNITHHSANASLLTHNANAGNPPISFPPFQVPVNAGPVVLGNSYPRRLLDRSTTAGLVAAVPRDEDVLMSLQLLAYVSKYCNLRSYFQNSHLVPKLEIGKELASDDEYGAAQSPCHEDVDEEYLVPDDFNIFPLVEKFTVRHHTSDMKYWAGVVMRNLCRKDDSRGGIRQCAYYQCGKWEEYTRQFAKCRRCRRTKYCSKDCQKSAWVYHRHWCVAANP